MSKIALNGNANGSGTLTIASPNTNSDRTLTLPDSTGTIATAESTLAQFSASGSAPVYACRAWVNFNGTGTVAIRASGNVSSITDNGTGDYTVNFATALPDANYTVVFGSTGQAVGDNRASAVIQGVYNTGATTKTTSALRINTGATSSATPFDMAEIDVTIFR